MTRPQLSLNVFPGRITGEGQRVSGTEGVPRQGHLACLRQSPRRADYSFVENSYISYGHRTMNTRLPVRSAIFKHRIARLVLQWVTMRESRVL